MHDCGDPTHPPPQKLRLLLLNHLPAITTHQKDQPLQPGLLA
jgi:hypothetical protein